MSGQLMMETWLLPKGAKCADPAAPLGNMQRFAPPEKRCASRDGHGNQCKWWFLKSDPHKECPKCRRAAHRENTGELGVKRKARFEDAHPGDKAERNRKCEDAHPGRKAEHNRKWKLNHPEKVKADDAAWNGTVQATFTKMMSKFGLNGLNGSFSTKAEKLGFQDADDLKKHFSDRFAPGMTFANHGVQRRDGPLMWHIGHMIIPQCAYNRESEADQLRCFHRSNLKPQWAPENLRQARTLVSNDVLLENRHLWPLAWGDELPTEVERARIENRRIDERFLHVHEDDINAVLADEEANEYESEASGSD
jgi:hypothetical protein